MKKGPILSKDMKRSLILFSILDAVFWRLLWGPLWTPG